MHCGTGAGSRERPCRRYRSIGGAADGAADCGGAGVLAVGTRQVYLDGWVEAVVFASADLHAGQETLKDQRSLRLIRQLFFYCRETKRVLPRWGGLISLSALSTSNHRDIAHVKTE